MNLAHARVAIESAIGRAEILDDHELAFAPDFGVAPRDGSVLKGESTIGSGAHNQGGRADARALSLVDALGDEQPRRSWTLLGDRPTSGGEYLSDVLPFHRFGHRSRDSIISGLSPLRSTASDARTLARVKPVRCAA